METVRTMTVCRKVRYRDRIAALLAMSNTQRVDGSHRPKIETRAYRCPHCFGWHLTSQKPRGR